LLALEATGLRSTTEDVERGRLLVHPDMFARDTLKVAVLLLASDDLDDMARERVMFSPVLEDVKHISTTALEAEDEVVKFSPRLTAPESRVV
jgi:hypothetical protein